MQPGNLTTRAKRNIIRMAIFACNLVLVPYFLKQEMVNQLRYALVYLKSQKCTHQYSRHITVQTWCCKEVCPWEASLKKSVGSLLHDGYGWTASNMLAGKANHFSICLQVAWLMREKNKLHKNTQTHKTDQTSELIKQMASCDLGLFRGIFGRRDDNAMFPSHGAYMWVIRPGSCQ